METAVLRIRLFGAFDLRREPGETLPLESSRAVSLLAFLILHPGVPQSRQRLAYLLWPDSSESQARTNLRHVIHNLRRSIPDLDRFVDISSQTLRWRSEASFQVDVERFNEFVSTTGVDDDLLIDALRRAVDLYGGDLLEGHYDEWMFGVREELRLKCRDALERITQLLEARGNLEEALLYGERLLRLDPIDESSYRILMRLYDASGNRARAARVYHECVTMLERELGVEPSQQTVMAYQSLLPREHGSDDATHSEARRAGGPALVGRLAERRRLTALWRDTERGRARFVLLTGEPGVGKTRLVEELASWCAHRGTRVSEARSYAAEGALAFGPVIAWLRSPTINTHLQRLDPATLTDVARLLPELVVELAGVRSPQPLPVDEHRQRLYDAITRAILAVGEPLLLVADDLQWSDAETLQFVHYLLRVEPHARLLVVGTARLEEIDQYHPLSQLVIGLQALDRYAEIAVEPLTKLETGLLAASHADRAVSPADIDQLFRETEGNPLFVVEAIRAGWKGAGSGSFALSPRVKAVVQARLAQLSSPARELVGVAAVFGGAFTADMLTHASATQEHAVVQGLDDLWRRRLIAERGVDGYDFTHDKIREVAYESLSPVVRRMNHQRAAAALEQLRAPELGAASAQIALHYDRAGMADQAVTWYERAADAAQQLHANAEAIRLLRRGIDLLRGLPETPERQARELAFLTALPSPLVALEGYQSQYVLEIHERAASLARVLGVELAPPLLWSLAVASMSRGDAEAARLYGRQLQERGERDGDDVLVVQSEYLLGITAFWNGEFVLSRSHFESAMQRFRPADLRSHLLRYGQDPTLLCQMRLALALWFLGHPADARHARDAVLASAATHAHRYSRLTVVLFAGLFAIETGEHDRLRECVAALASVLDEREPTHTQVGVDVVTGYVDVLDGRPEVGFSRIERGLAASLTFFPAPGIRSFLARVLLAACRETGDARAGLAAADRLLKSDDGVRTWDAEACRLRAEFMAELGAGTDAVEAELSLALETARHQQARLLELRVATSMLRHRYVCQDAAAVREARDLLASLLTAVSDGSEMLDFREAAALLSKA